VRHVTAIVGWIWRKWGGAGAKKGGWPRLAKTLRKLCGILESHTPHQFVRTNTGAKLAMPPAMVDAGQEIFLSS